MPHTAYHQRRTCTLHVPSSGHAGQNNIKALTGKLRESLIREMDTGYPVSGVVEIDGWHFVANRAKGVCAKTRPEDVAAALETKTQR